MKQIVLLKSRSNNCGGLEKNAARIADAFSSRGHQVKILTSGSSHSASEKIVAFKTVSWPGFVRLEQFDRSVQDWLGKNQADLVFGMDRNREQTHIRAGNGVHAAYLDSRIHTEGKFKHWLCLMNPLHRKILEIEKAAFENPRLKKLFANSAMVRRQILTRYKIDPAKVEVIHNGVEWSEMEGDFTSWKEGKAAALKKFQLDPGKFHFLFIGHGFLRKGLDRLLEALSLLPFRNFHLSVVGKDKRTGFYRDLVGRLGLKNQVRFFGAVAEIRPFYQLADALVIPSFYDPFANVTVEALAMGLFVVSSKYNGGSEILTPENGCIIERLLDPDSMTHALMQAVQRPKTGSSSQICRKSVSHLDFPKQLSKLIDACG